MAYKTVDRCKVCTSQYRLEIEESRIKRNSTYDQISSDLKSKYGFHVSIKSIQRHMVNHFDPTTPALEMVQSASKLLFDETFVDKAHRGAKLSGMISASYDYINHHLNELDMKTALQMLFGSVDQLNKMEGMGAFAGNDFFLGLLDLIKRMDEKVPKQAELIYNADKDGQAILVESKIDEITEILPDE